MKVRGDRLRPGERRDGGIPARLPRGFLEQPEEAKTVMDVAERMRRVVQMPPSLPAGCEPWAMSVHGNPGVICAGDSGSNGRVLEGFVVFPFP